MLTQMQTSGLTSGQAGEQVSLDPDVQRGKSCGRSLKNKLRANESREWRTRSRAETMAALDRAALLCTEQGLSIRAAAKRERVSRAALTPRLWGKIPPQPKRAIGDEDVPALVRALDKLTEAQVAAKRGVAVETLRRALRRAGVPKRRPGRPKKSKAKALQDRRADPKTKQFWEAYRRGASCAEVGEAFGLTASGVYRRLRAAGYRLRRGRATSIAKRVERNPATWPDKV